VELQPSKDAPATSRRAVREEFAGRFPAEAVECAELIASELTTNAVKYGVPDIVLTVHDGDGQLHVELEDRGGSFDPRPDPDPERGGFGLQIVAALADDWGIDDIEDGVRVWAIVPPDPPALDA
jgi:anti-sigma regulatory factor (Ser/Thr protein kinase)